MVVWGGISVASGRYDLPIAGGRYDPSGDVWALTSTSGTPSGRYFHSAVWTGSRMIVWGGIDLMSGGRYDPGLDADCDGRVDAEDCAVLDPGAFDVPAEVTGLMFEADRATLIWDPAAPGSGAATIHDVLRGALDELPVGGGASETCLVSGIAGATLNDGTLPGEGEGFFYLVRARNSCGTGSYGFQSDGAARLSAACP